MGSTNVACSISRISMGKGTKVVYLPLLPSSFEFNLPHYIEPGNQLVYAHCYFHPFCLPIKGAYNDYRGLEQIEEDDNIRALERFFDMSIYKFLECMGEDLFHPSAVFPKIHGQHQELFTTKPYAKVDEDFLQTLGFTKEEDGYRIGDFPYVVTCEEALEIQDEEGNVVSQCKGLNQKQELLVSFFRLTNYYLHIKPAYQTQAFVVSQLSGMFIHREIYEELVAMNEEKREKYLQEYAEFQGVIQEVPNMEETKQDHQRSIAALEAFLATCEDEQQRKLFEGMLQQKKNLKYHDEYDFLIKKQAFLGHFKQLYFFKTLYHELLVKGKLATELTDLRLVYHSMYEGNHFFFPAMNGEQDGNIAASQRLFQKALEITEQQQKKI